MKKTLVLFLAGACVLLAAGEITLAENGRAKARIVIPVNALPIVRFAAEELAAHLKKMTGAEFPVGTVPGQEVNLHLGEGDAKDFAADEYVISARGRRIDIYGKDSKGRVDLFRYFYDDPGKGTLRGVYNFLDSLGVRWLAPGEDGCHVPLRRTLRVPEGHLRFNPVFRDRQIADAWSFMKFPDAKRYVKEPGEVFLWGIRNNVSTRGMVPGCHSERSLKLFRNPEWLAHPSAHQLRKDGKRDPKYSCWTDPFTKEIWMRVADGYFAGKTPKECGFDLKRYGSSLWPMPFISPDEFMIDPMDHSRANDGRCRCARCEKFRKEHPGADDTEIIWNVIGGVADHVEKKYPGRYISTLVYPPKQGIPQRLRSPRNIRVRICLAGARAMIFPGDLREELELLKSWGDFLGAENIPLWVYHCMADFGRFLPGVPDVYPNLVGGYIQKLRSSCAGMFCENHQQTHTFRNLDVYIFMRLLWDPDRDVKRELADYFQLYYGPAAGPAEKLYALFENNWIRVERMLRAGRDDRSDPASRSRLTGIVRENGEHWRKQVWSRIYTPEEMKKIASLMDEMKRLVPAGSVYARRVELLKKYLVDVMRSERAEVMDKEETRKKLRLTVKPTAAETFPSDREWELAPEYRLISAERMKPRLSAPGTFRVLASRDMLFLRADLKDPRMTETKTDHARRSGDQEIWRDNGIELFFYAEKSKKFWQILINDNGAWSSQTRGRVLPRWEQLAGLRLATRRTGSGWTADIAIPLRELKTDRSDLRFNFARERNVRGEKTEYATWSPLAMLGNWHAVENYATVIFE